MVMVNLMTPTRTLMQTTLLPRVSLHDRVECYGELQCTAMVLYYLLYCDTDYYWKGSQQFCVDHGYDGLATAKDDEEFQFLTTGLDTHRSYTPTNGSTRGNVWVGLTRGPDCAPVANTNTGFTSVCSQDVRDYYWIDGSDTSYMEADVGAYWSDGEMAYLNPAGGVLVCTTMTSIVHT